VAGRIAKTASTAEKKAAAPRISIGSGAGALRAWPIVIVKITKVAPIRMLALWSAIAESCTWICCAVRTR
jgi:hypothetical protein